MHDDQDYGTHRKVLVGLAMTYPIVKVLETGSGHFSTSLFLDHDAFPHLLRLHSYETDSDWANEIDDKHRDDPRLQLELVEQAELASKLEKVALQMYDLILIDDGGSAEDRIATIEQVFDHAPYLPPVVIHDAQIPEYVDAAGEAMEGYIFAEHEPWTAVFYDPVKHNHVTHERLSQIKVLCDLP